MKKRMMLFLYSLFACIGLVIAQSNTISGTVVDDSGETVIGASVIVKGATIGTVTDIDGKFSINVPSGNSTLVISLIGMKTVEAEAKPGMRVVMRNDNELLDEVMVVAYGTAKKSSFTGSAKVVKAEDIQNIQTSSVSKALAGKMSGVQVSSLSGRPGSDATIRVRGVGSINAVNDPLYVVDGVPYEGELNSINQQDIESITVLKDAAANSLYGARGANGVILITTKKGSLNGKSRVTVDAKWGVNSRAVPLYETVSNQGQFYELAWEALRNQQHYALGNDWATAGQLASSQLVSKLGGYNSYNVADAQLVDPVTGKLNSNAKLLYSDDWEDEIFSNGFRQDYQVGVSGGNSNTSYYFSLGYLNDEGIVDNSGFERISSRLRLDHSVTDWFKVGANVAYTRTNTNYTDDDNTQGSNPFYILQTMPSIYPVYEYDANGNRLYEKDGTPIYDFGSGDVNPDHTRPVSAMANPVASQVLDKDKRHVDFFSGHAFAEIRFLNDFKFTANIRIDNTDNQRLLYQNGKYGQFVDANGSSYRYSYKTSVMNANQLLDWNKTFGDHNLAVLLGHESYQYKYNYMSASRTNFFDPTNNELDGAVSNQRSSSYENNHRIESVLSRVQYDYLSKYFLSASFRTDGSSRFHKNNRWGQFWSGGASWLITREDFMKDIKWLDELKFKISYGTQGNDRLYNAEDYPQKVVSPWATQYLIVNNADSPSLLPYSMGNEDLTWEKSHSFNTGIEFSVLKNRLYGGIEYFSRKTSNMLFDLRSPLSGGYASYPANIGDMTNRGVEFEITGRVIDTRDWKWDVSFNATHYKSKITKLPYDEVDNVLFNLKKGRDRYDYYLRQFAGLNDQGQSLWYMDVLDGNNNPTGERTTTTDYNSATRYYCGDALPDVFGGLSTTVSWKGFDLSVQTTYQWGGKGFDYGYMNLMHGGGDNLGYAWHKDMLNSWREDNTDTSIPRLQNGETNVNGRFSDRWLISSDFFSIQNITLGYTFPKSVTGKMKIESLRIYGVADNVALFSKRKGYDPREDVAGVSGYGRYSQIRTISFGVNLGF